MIRHLLFALLLLLPWSGPVLAAEPPPDQVIQQITDRMIALILQEKSRFDREPQHFYQAIDQLMTPASDFDRIAKGVMGKYYRQASDAQRKRFAGVFKERMLQTYAKAFMNFDNQKIVVLPYRPQPGDEPGQASVMMEVHGHDGTIYPVAYSMFLDDARQWRVQNVIVNGINLGLTFRSQFASSMDQKQNIDQVIDGWSAELDEVNKVTRKG